MMVISGLSQSLGVDLGALKVYVLISGCRSKNERSWGYKKNCVDLGN